MSFASSVQGFMAFGRKLLPYLNYGYTTVQMSLQDPSPAASVELVVSPAHEQEFEIRLHSLFNAVAEICANALLTREEKGTLELSDGEKWRDPLCIRFVELFQFRNGNLAAVQADTVRVTNSKHIAKSESERKAISDSIQQKQEIENAFLEPITLLMNKTFQVLMENDLAVLAMCFAEKAACEGRFTRPAFTSAIAKAWEEAVVSMSSDVQTTAAGRVSRQSKMPHPMLQAAGRVEYNNKPRMTADEYCREDFGGHIARRMAALRGDSWAYVI